MPANINTYIGRQAAWHALGTVTGKYQTWADILAHGGLDFNVFKSQLHDGRGKKVNAWGTFRWNLKDKAVGNSDAAEFLGTVGEDYKVIQHTTGFELVDAMMQTADSAHYETAGVLGNGEVVWGLADLGLRVHVGKDEQKPYLLFATAHDGSYSYQFRTCMERVVCQNTLNVALGEKARASFKIRHTTNAMAKVQNAHEALASFANDTRTVEEKLNFLAGKRMVREAYKKIMDRLFPVRTKQDANGDDVEVSQTRRENILADIVQLYEHNDGDAFPEQAGTAYALLNAVTAYTDHMRSTKADGRAESALFGSGDKLKSSALDLILGEAKDLPTARWAQPGIQVDFADLGLNVPVATGTAGN